MFIVLKQKRHIVPSEVIIHAQRQPKQRYISRRCDLVQLCLYPVEQCIVEELVFDRDLLAIVEHLQEEAGACVGKQLLDMLGLVLADALQTAEGLLVLDATT